MFSMRYTSHSARVKIPFDLGMVLISLLPGEASQQLPPSPGPQGSIKRDPSTLKFGRSFWPSHPELSSLLVFVLDVDILWPFLPFDWKPGLPWSRVQNDSSPGSPDQPTLPS